ncbi:MAG: hypothetical protein QXP70_04415, partial [Methanomassiliicoccales archaeon]
GHITGSSMFLIEDDCRILYTGDFCTRRKVYLEPAKPVKTDVLIMETTFGDPRYRFPDPLHLASVIREWTEDMLGEGLFPVFRIYPLGKAQELTEILRGVPLFGDTSVIEHNRICLGNRQPVRPLEEMSTLGGAILLSQHSRAALPPHVRHRTVIAGASGWYAESGARYKAGLDEAFPLSDHCDFQDLMEFARKCDPSVIYTVHGFQEQFASELRSELQVEAIPLSRRKGQSHITDY